VFDVILALIFARALFVSAWRRFPAGFLACTAGSLLWAGLAVSGWLGRRADGMDVAGVLILCFVGPSAVPGPTPAVPGSALLADHPIGAKLLIAAIFAVAFALAWRRALGGSPLSDEASRWKRLALVYLVPVLLLLAQGVCLELTEIAAEAI
jgi:hypothetical protein